MRQKDEFRGDRDSNLEMNIIVEILFVISRRINKISFTSIELYELN